MERIMTHLVDVAVTILIFFLYSCIRKGRLPLLQRLYVAASAFLLIWLLAIAGILGVLTAVCRCSPYWTLSPAVPAR
ncbi:hypothetical protein LC724_04585 [Blautia sp. RD014234]|nr:hypothetical protein [Blautia parvula]